MRFGDATREDWLLWINKELEPPVVATGFQIELLTAFKSVIENRKTKTDLTEKVYRVAEIAIKEKVLKNDILYVYKAYLDAYKYYFDKGK
jgi:hypothetical protein